MEMRSENGEQERGARLWRETEVQGCLVLCDGCGGDLPAGSRQCGCTTKSALLLLKEFCSCRENRNDHFKLNKYEKFYQQQGFLERCAHVYGCFMSVLHHLCSGGVLAGNSGRVQPWMERGITAVPATLL